MEMEMSYLIALVGFLTQFQHILGNLLQRRYVDPYAPAKVTVFEVINQICALDNFSPEKLDENAMRLRLFTPCKIDDFPLGNSSQIVRSPYFDVLKKVAIFIHGWSSNTEAGYVYKMANAFGCRGDYNFLALDSGNYIQGFYYRSANNTEEIGRLLALSLQRLVEFVPVKNIHLIGHSLGAHIAGYAGHYFTKYTGLKIPRITGLDPARPCFAWQLESYGLKKEHAEFVVVIHTNMGVLGTITPDGHADFYPKLSVTSVPGCGFDDSCAHARALEYFTESIYPGNENNFLVIYCNGSDLCYKVPMGLATPHDLRGVFFVHFNPQKPYGNNANTREINCAKKTEDCFVDQNPIKIAAFELFNSTRDVLVKYPESLNMPFSMKDICIVVNTIPSYYSTFVPPKRMTHLKLYTPDDEEDFPLEDAPKLIKNPCFDASKKVAILVTGWVEDADYVSDMIGAFNKREDYNLLVFSTSDSIENLYTWNSYDTELVGCTLGVALNQILLKNPGLYIHLIGHSLGAHIAGFAGYCYSLLSKKKIQRITGLDPAAPCFSLGRKSRGLQRGNAEFVDVIHTNPGVLGRADPIGDIDFYVEGLTSSKPGCTTFGCSHVRAYDYFIESVNPGNEYNFIATNCTYLEEPSKMCNGTEVPMGLVAPSNMTGIYFLSVNDESPYGKKSKKPEMNKEVIETPFGPLYMPTLMGGLLLDQSKEALLDKPEAHDMSLSIEDVCLAIGNISHFRFKPPKTSLHLKLYTPLRNFSFALTDASKIANHPFFNANKKVAILITGWMGDAGYENRMADAFVCRGDYNFLVLNISASIDNFLIWSSYNTDYVGYSLALVLIELVKHYPSLYIHLIGHSLGAHIAGYAGHHYTLATKLMIQRITGLDPAETCLTYGRKSHGLQHDHAQFVDIIHTNPGFLGKADHLGDVDFYVEGFNTLKPGCTKFGCSHNRAYDYFIESVFPGLEFNFMAVNCDSLGAHRHVCDGPRDPMGLEVPYGLQGLYYLSVNAESPYGKNDMGCEIICQC